MNVCSIDVDHVVFNISLANITWGIPHGTKCTLSCFLVLVCCRISFNLTRITYRIKNYRAITVLDGIYSNN